MRIRLQTLAAVATIVLIGSATLFADRVKLRTGQAVEGSFMSADVKVVRVLLANGRIAEFPVDDVAALEFSPRKAAAPPPPVTPDPAKAPAPVTLPANTM